MRSLQQPGLTHTALNPHPNRLWDDIDRLVWRGKRTIRFALNLCPVLRHASGKGNGKSSARRTGSGSSLLAGYLAYQGSYVRGLIRSFHWWTALQEVAGKLPPSPGVFRFRIPPGPRPPGTPDTPEISCPRSRSVRGQPERSSQPGTHGYQPPGAPPLRRPELHGILHRIEGPVPGRPVGGIYCISSSSQKIRHGVTKSYKEEMQYIPPTGRQERDPRFYGECHATTVFVMEEPGGW